MLTVLRLTHFPELTPSRSAHVRVGVGPRVLGLLGRVLRSKFLCFFLHFSAPSPLSVCLAVFPSLPVLFYHMRFFGRQDPGVLPEGPAWCSDRESVTDAVEVRAQQHGRPQSSPRGPRPSCPRAPRELPAPLGCKPDARRGRSCFPGSPGYRRGFWLEPPLGDADPVGAHDVSTPATRHLGSWGAGRRRSHARAAVSMQGRAAVCFPIFNPCNTPGLCPGRGHQGEAAVNAWCASLRVSRSRRFSGTSTGASTWRLRARVLEKLPDVAPGGRGALRCHRRRVQFRRPGRRWAPLAWSSKFASLC